MEAAKSLVASPSSPDKTSSNRASSSDMDGFTPEDRERVLELLLSQERVVSLLYAKTFPVHVKHSGLALDDSHNEPNTSLGGGLGGGLAPTPPLWSLWALWCLVLGVYRV